MELTLACELATPVKLVRVLQSLGTRAAPCSTRLEQSASDASPPCVCTFRVKKHPPSNRPFCLWVLDGSRLYCCLPRDSAVTVTLQLSPPKWDSVVTRHSTSCQGGARSLVKFGISRVVLCSLVSSLQVPSRFHSAYGRVGPLADPGIVCHTPNCTEGIISPYRLP